jgi:FkbM family methyltransferase
VSQSTAGGHAILQRVTWKHRHPLSYDQRCVSRRVSKSDHLGNKVRLIDSIKSSAYAVIDGALTKVAWRASLDMRLKVFRIFGRQLGVKTYTADGSLGWFEGGLEDRYVMPAYLYGTYEPALQHLLMDCIFGDGNGTIIDVGANIGLTSVPLVRSRGVRCFAIEADPENFKLLQRNILGNGVESKISALNVAAFSHATTVEFELSLNNLGDHRIRNASHHGRRIDAFDETNRPVITVPADTLDNLLGGELATMARPIAMKIDIQGAEVQAFTGAPRLLAELDYLIAELWPYGLERSGASVSQFLQSLARFPYGATYDRSVSAKNVRTPKLEPIDDLIAQLTASSSGRPPLWDVDLIVSRSSSFPHA